MTILRAHGRLRVPEMNRTERDYAALLAVRRAAGEVAWFAFEPLKLRLADNTFYTPDFIVMLANGLLEVHEVKGYWQDDARVKIKVAAKTFPFKFIGATWDKKLQGWKYEEF